MLYGLIGYPVKHSFSAVMQNAAFSHLGLDAEYQLFEVSPEKLDNFFKNTIAEKKIKGFNVTVPHKERAMGYLGASISPIVKMNRAVNTIRVEPNGTLSGSNTDGAGFSMDLKERRLSVAGRNVSLIGAGGGAKSIATSIAGIRPSKLLIYDIDASKALALQDILGRYFPSVQAKSVGSIEELDIARADFLINATPIGMKEADPLLVDGNLLHRGLFVYDLVYNPAETKLLKAAKEKGCNTANGLGMLLYQGALAFEYWTGKQAPVSVMREALERAVDSRQ